MSGHRHHGGGGGRMGGPVGGLPPTAPPPPVLSSSGRQGGSGGGRNIRRSRSRSPRSFNRSRSDNNRYPPNRQDVNVREERGRGGGGRIRQSRSRSRSRSPSPFASAATNVAADLYRSSKGSSSPMLSHGLTNHHHAAPRPRPPLAKSQSISLITGEGSLPIIRRILDPDSVKIPRRLGEGSRPIFDRDELKEGLRRRFAADDEDGRGGGNPSPVIPPPSQRVIAIIREPTLGSRTMGSDSYRLPSSSSKDLDRSAAGYGGALLRDPEPAHHHQRDFRDRQQRQQQRSISPPTRDRDLRDRPRERPSLAPTATASSIQRSGGDRERGRGGGGGEADLRIRSRSKDRVARDRTQPQNSRPNQNRSPVRILRERASRSHSRTPPPMPAEIRRQMMERQRDLRSKLSRPAGRFAGAKFEPNEQQIDFRGGGDSSFRGRGGGGFVRGRGGFRGRDDGRSAGRGFWEHDLFEREGVDGDLKSNKA